MISWRNISISAKVLALFITLVVVGLLIYSTTQFVYGRVTIASPTQGALVGGKGDETLRPVPQTFRLKPGKYTFVLTAPNALDKEIKIVVTAFRHKKESVALEKPKYNFSDPEARKKIPLFADLPYKTTHFEVDVPEPSGVYKVTLFASLNTLDERSYALYQKELNAYGQEVVEWIRSKNVDPTSISIEWLPEKPSGISFGSSAEE